MNEKGLDKKPDFFRNPSGLPSPSKTDRGGNVGQTVIPIIQILKHTFKYSDFNNSNALASIKHGLNGLYEVVGRYQSGVDSNGRKDDSIWHIMSNMGQLEGLSNPYGTVLLRKNTANEIFFYITFGTFTPYPDIKLELYFLQFSP